MKPPPGPFRPEFWRSPLRGPWLASILGSALLPLILICAITGFLSQAAYQPGLGDNSLLPGGGLNVYFFDWPTHPSWLYAFTQGLHVVSGLAAIPLLLAKLWSAMPKLFEWPPVRSIAHSLERASLALLVGGSIFVFFTGVLNIQNYYPWSFSFVPSHYYAAIIFLAALGLHVGLKIGTVRSSFREQGVVKPLRDGLAETRPEPPAADSTAPSDPIAPTISRRAMLGTVGAASAGLVVMGAAQSIGGPLRPLALLAPRGRNPSGANGFQVNRTAAAARITADQTGPSWVLNVSGPREVRLSRPQLLALEQSTHDLTIGCVEGWSTTQSWTGIPLPDLARLAGVSGATEAHVESLEKGGGFNHVYLSSSQAGDKRCMLALKVNGEDLAMDHGFPARLIVPAAPGVHNTKWVSSITFTEA